MNLLSGLSYFQDCLYICDTNNHVIKKINLNNLEVKKIEFLGLCAPGACFRE